MGNGEPDTRKPRAVVFDDEAIILDVFRTFLTRRGYEVLTYHEPTACPLYQDHAGGCAELVPCADIIITDFKMPQMDGVELLRRQSRRGCSVDARNRAIISGGDESEIQSEVGELGCAFFRKPIRFEELSRWLGECEQRMDLSQPLSPLEKRKQPRYPYHAMIEYHCIGDQNERSRSLTLNMSESGMCLYLFEQCSEGQAITIESALPSGAQKATVRWVKGLQDNFWIAGLMFV
jgi:CheY-like chemotaxis protein